MKNSKLFWISYSDIMTSIFFVMLVLFTVMIIINASLESEIDKLKNALIVETKEKAEMEAIQQALTSLDSKYFLFDGENKRYRLSIDVNFNPNEANINVVGPETMQSLYQAGLELYNKINSLIQTNENVHYLLIIEGNTQRSLLESGWNYLIMPDVGYELSYRRALALYNFWISNGIDFRKLEPNCEIIIAGSGYFALSRDDNEAFNRRFTLQITSKWKLES